MPRKLAKTYRQFALRLSPRDDAAIAAIIKAGFAQNSSGAIRVALQRFAAEVARAA